MQQETWQCRVGTGGGGTLETGFEGPAAQGQREVERTLRHMMGADRHLCVHCFWKIMTTTLVVLLPLFSVYVLPQHLLTLNTSRQTSGSCLRCEHTAHHACLMGFGMMPRAGKAPPSLPLVPPVAQDLSQPPSLLDFFPELFSLDLSAFP